MKSSPSSERYHRGLNGLENGRYSMPDPNYTIPVGGLQCQIYQ